ncbi:MAG: hypothetical protein U0164_19040 [Gemmatimonadaceae bacterium]
MHTFRRSVSRLVAAALPSLWLACAGATDEGARTFDVQLTGVPPFLEGDTVTVVGRGLEHADVRVNGSHVETLQRDSDRLRFVLVAGVLPRCTGEPLAVPLEVVSPEASRSLDLPTLGAAPLVDPSPGESVVLQDWGANRCGVVLPAGADYDLAVVRVVDATDEGTTTVSPLRRTFVLDARPVDRADVGEGHALVRSARSAWKRHQERGLAPEVRTTVPLATASSAGHACAPPLQAGDSVQLIQSSASPSAQAEPTAWYQLASTSPHVGVLVRSAELQRLSTAQRAEVWSLADTLERSAIAFLRRAFTPWPDVDDDPRLFVAYGPLTGVAGLGASPKARVDGCDIDLIWLSSSLAVSPSTAQHSLSSVLVHEGAHWADASAEPLHRKPAWSIEGFAALAQQLWHEENAGISFRGRDFSGPYCGEGCSLLLLRDERLGYPGLAAGESVNGASILRYLVQQALTEEASPLVGLDRLRRRRGAVRFSPSFEVLGGTGRTEAELAADFLLQFSQSGMSPGASPRIRHATFDLNGAAWRIPGLQNFPLRSFRIDGTRAQSIALSLARPDGMVGEVHAGTRPVLLAPRQDDAMAIGVARRR